MTTVKQALPDFVQETGLGNRWILAGIFVRNGTGFLGQEGFVYRKRGTFEQDQVSYGYVEVAEVRGLW